MLVRTPPCSAPLTNSSGDRREFWVKARGRESRSKGETGCSNRRPQGRGSGRRLGTLFGANRLPVCRSSCGGLAGTPASVAHDKAICAAEWLRNAGQRAAPVRHDASYGVTKCSVPNPSLVKSRLSRTVLIAARTPRQRRGWRQLDRWAAAGDQC